VAAAAAALIFTFSLQAKSKHPKAADTSSQDRIQVVGHIPALKSPVTGFLTTRHYSSDYVYVEYRGGAALIDVTHPGQPSVIGNVAYSGDASNLFAAAGTATLVIGGQAAAQPATAPQTVRIVNFAGPGQTQVVSEFTGVTAIGRDDPRGLIFLANADGVWILRQQLAEDPEVERRYAHDALYDHE
jgi:hypothetical protein